MEQFFDVPVVLFAFNRPHLLKKHYEILQQLRPKKLFLVVDAARNGKDEAEEVEQCKSSFDEVSWECDVIKVFAAENMGCDSRIKSGLDYVFSQVEYAIILEDDCIPEISFFWFCRELLLKYKNEPIIKYIAGSNQIRNYKITDSYIFTYNAWTWGWATWKRAWQEQIDIKANWEDAKLQIDSINTISQNEKKGMIQTLENHIIKNEMPWDYNFTISMLIKNGLSIVPRCNLIVNAGFSGNATHTTGKIDGYVSKSEPMQFPLVHPETICEKKGYHYKAYRFLNPSIWKKIFEPKRYVNWIKRKYRVIRWER